MATRKDPLVDVLHGVPVPDPYRWLEDGESPEVRAWDEAQNARTRAWLEPLAGQEALRARARELLSVGYTGAPAARKTAGGAWRYFHVRREGSQEQATLYVREGHEDCDRVLVDPAPLSPDGTTTIDWWVPSPDGALVAWGLSEAGSEDSTLRIRDVQTGQDLPDRIAQTRHASVAWLPDGRTIFYTRYPAPGDVPVGDEKYFCRVYRHRLGDNPARDELVFGEGRDKLDVPAVLLSPAGRWLVVRVHMGWQRSEIRLLDLATPAAPWVAVAAGQEALYEPVPLDDALYLMSNEGAPRYRVFEVAYASPGRAQWKQIVPESEDVLTDLVVVGGAHRVIVAAYLHEASARDRAVRARRDVSRPRGPAGPRLGDARRRMGRRRGVRRAHVVRDAVAGAPRRHRVGRHDAVGPGRCRLRRERRAGLDAPRDEQGRYAGADVRRREDGHAARRGPPCG